MMTIRIVCYGRTGFHRPAGYDGTAHWNVIITLRAPVPVQGRVHCRTMDAVSWSWVRAAEWRGGGQGRA